MDIRWKIASSLFEPLLKSLSRRRLPNLKGEYHLAGLTDQVQIGRDQWGIPNIKARNRQDLYFAQGFIHAQDRLWQMEINRRAASGRLAEILGEAALPTDRLTRTLGFAHLGELSWNNTTDQVREDVTSYTNGVNAYLDTKPGLPVEFTLIRHKPERWTTQDSATFGRFMIWPLSHVWAGKLVRAKLLEKIGPDLASELEPYYPERNPVTLHKGIEFNNLEFESMFTTTDGPLLGQAMLGGSQGSNGWVISGNRTATGNAILCNDMHMPISTPSLWYYNGLTSSSGVSGDDNLHVTGVSLPGMPYVLVGHNERIAWGATVSFLDNEDLFIEKLDQAQPKHYLYQDEWKPLKTYSERIKVRGKPDFIEEVRETHHGPIISPILHENGQTLAIQSVALQDEEGFEGFARLNCARGWDDFVRAVYTMAVPPLNLLYADVTGNIGYHVTGRVPIRAKGQGQIPVPGWTGEFEWIGKIPVEEMPHALNPKQGFLVSANHKIVDETYPHYLGTSWRNGYRARRISELICSQDKMTTESCQRHQNDVMSIPGQEFIKHIARLKVHDPVALISLNILKEWDGVFDQWSRGGCVYKAVLDRLAKAILLPRLGQELLDSFLGVGVDPQLYPLNELHGQWSATILRLLADPNSDWWAPAYDQAGLLNKCLAETTRYLQEMLGRDPNKWHWGRLHQLKFSHILSAQPSLDRIFSHGPFAVGGDQDTVAQTTVIKGKPGDNIAASYRQIVDLGSLGDSIAMHTPGQSGNLASAHYGDLIELWLGGACYPMSWKEQEADTLGEQKMLLIPL